MKTDNMKTAGTLQAELDATLAKRNAAARALNAARLRMQSLVLVHKGDALGEVSDAALAAGEFTTDLDAARLAIAELERRTKEAAERAAELKAEIYHYRTGDAVNAYNAEVGALLEQLEAIAAAIRDAERKLSDAGVTDSDPRPFRVFRTRRQIESTVEEYHKRMRPRVKAVSQVLVKLGDGSMGTIPRADFERQQRRPAGKVPFVDFVPLPQGALPVGPQAVMAQHED